MTRRQLVDQIFTKKTYLCIGLDTDPAKIPVHLQFNADAVFEFNKQIIDETKDYCVSYKINTAFYEAQGVKGWEALQQTVEYIPATHLKIADAKRADIGNTSAQYAKAFFELLNFDAITVSPYMGEDSIKPFLEYKDKWTIVLALTSNQGAADFELQKMLVKNKAAVDVTELAWNVSSHETEYLYEKVIKTASKWGSEGNLMFVVGATQPEEFINIRQITPNHFLLLPGVGAQGGSLRAVSESLLIPDCGLLVNVSRAILYASGKEDFADEAKAIAMQYKYEMEQLLKKNTPLFDNQVEE